MPTVLERVRAALGHAGEPATPTLDPPRLRIPEVPIAERIDNFSRKLGLLGGKTDLCDSLPEAAEAVNRILGGRPAVASNAPLLADCGILSLPLVQSGFTDRDHLREACASAAFGITSADYALADTGSLVLLASPAEARLISLLPPAHIAVVSRAKILTGLDELFSILPRPAEASSSMVLITGPSRTADIEQILVRGVHGPGEIHVILV